VPRVCFYGFGLLVEIPHEAGARFLVTRILCELRPVQTACHDVHIRPFPPHVDTPRLNFTNGGARPTPKERDAIAASLRPSSKGEQQMERSGRRPPHLTLLARPGSLAVTQLHTFGTNHAQGGSPCVRLEPDAGAKATRAGAQLGTRDTQSSDTPCSQTDLAAPSTGNHRTLSMRRKLHTQTSENCKPFSCAHDATKSSKICQPPDVRHQLTLVR
jgi:hypothetical protein